MSVAIAGDHVETLLRVPMSYEEYLRLPSHPRHEWVDGLVVMAPAPSGPHQQAARRLANLLEESLSACYVTEAAGVRLPRDRERIPDVLVFATEPASWPAERAPVAVVEVLSPSTRGEDLLRKAPEYAEAGIAQYWVVDIDARIIEVQVNVEGRWELLATVDGAHPTADVPVGDHGTVPLDLAAVLR
ncbi:Uma2 family endonuclease [Nocardioides sp. L-11A]|uniref:Uma2 family endonuclease n=1 Tax=Nocardioides sp. L-11A TaxID=3043848 RepID=UPI00249A1D20|nr:Uma2 family endonuclease [Nocardioides sp. L-11A]